MKETVCGGTAGNAHSVDDDTVCEVDIVGSGDAVWGDAVGCVTVGGCNTVGGGESGGNTVGGCDSTV